MLIVILNSQHPHTLTIMEKVMRKIQLSMLKGIKRKHLTNMNRNALEHIKNITACAKLVENLNPFRIL